VADLLVEAIRTRKLAELRAAVRQASGLSKRAVVEAARLVFTKALALLHKNGADLNGIWRGYRPLHALLQEDPHTAAGKPSPERLACLEWLLDHGADPEQLGAWPAARAIIIEALVGEPEYVKRLQKAGAKLDGFAAAALGDRKLVEKTLAKRPGFANDRDSRGLTGLQCASGSRYPRAKLFEIARLLLDAGADLGARTKSWNHDVGAVNFAASAKHKDIFELLLERGADPTEALVPALWNARPDFAELALAHGAIPDGAHSNGKPLLNDLIRWGQIPPMLWLLAHGASPNIPDDEGWTAIHQAVSRGNERMLRAALNAGGDLRRRDRLGRTPLDVAEIMKRRKLIPMLS
jgi:ankyrin repeat protein